MRGPPCGYVGWLSTQGAWRDQQITMKMTQDTPKHLSFTLGKITAAAALLAVALTSPAQAGDVLGGGENTATGKKAAVVAGTKNSAGGDKATVVGGAKNAAEALGAAVLTGTNNINSGSNSGIVSGNNNKIEPTATKAAILSGARNSNAGVNSAILSGVFNMIGANGSNSIAAGVKASAKHPNSFVFNGNSAVPLQTTAEGQVLMAAPGGAKIIGDLEVTGALTVSGGGVGVTGASIDPVTGNLILTLSDGSTITAGSVREANFGSFSIAFTPIGNPSNADDSTGYGQVAYEYSISTYEVSRAQIEAYNAAADPDITLYDMSSLGGNGANKPATGVSWNEAARFVNWLNTSQGYQAAYKFTTGGANDNIALWSSSEAWQQGGQNLYRHKDAKYFLPSEDEWYKAAYYKGGGTNAGYWDYATGSDTAPGATSGGRAAGTAVYDQNYSTGPADITNAGGLSPYGTMAQNGNVWEWCESGYTAPNDSAVESRVLRGGFWDSLSGGLQSSDRGGLNPGLKASARSGFRVAAVPE